MKTRTVVTLVVFAGVVLVAVVPELAHLTRVLRIPGQFAERPVPLGRGVPIATAGKPGDPVAIGGRAFIEGVGPAADVRVRLYSLHPRLLLFGGSDEPIAELHTFSNGWFVFRSTAPGPFEVRAEGGGDLCSTNDDAKRGSLRALLPLVEGGEVAGRVLDEHGTPIADVVVKVMGAPVAITGKNGTFKASKVPPTLRGDPAYVSFSAAGYGELTVWTDVRAGKVATLPKNVVLRSRTGIRGRVLGPDGHPVEGAEVLIASAESPGKLSPTTTTDAAGCWFIAEPFGHSAAPNDHFVIEVTSERFLPATIRVQHERAALTKAPTVSLEAGGAMTGTIRGPDGKPLPGAEVILGLATGRGRNASLASAPGLDEIEPRQTKDGGITRQTRGSIGGPGPGTARWFLSNGWGQFRFRGLAKGQYVLLVRAKGCASWRKGDITVCKEKPTTVTVSLSRAK